jgi:hypothetical protein
MLKILSWIKQHFLSRWKWIQGTILSGKHQLVHILISEQVCSNHHSASQPRSIKQTETSDIRKWWNKLAHNDDCPNYDSTPNYCWEEKVRTGNQLDTNVCEIAIRVHPVKNRYCQRNSQIRMGLPWIRLARYTARLRLKRHRMTERHNHKKQSLSTKKEPLRMQSVHEETVTLQKHMHFESKNPWKSRDLRTRKQNVQICC